jgi:RHS repeat-associated protein
LGSLLLTTDDQGNPLHEQNFDAWGNQRDPNTWQPLPGAPQPSLGDRGYTFHEHLPQFALINMNGRVYDPVLGRFLSPDPYVQAPTNTQNYNRYSYVLNNPLKYTDPSGEVIFTLAALLIPGGQVFLPLAISMDVGWMTGGISADYRGMSFTDGAWRGLILGTLGGFMGLTTTGGGLFANVALDAIKGGFVGAVGAGLYGNDMRQGFWIGAAYGATFSLATSIIQMAHNAKGGHGFRTNYGVRNHYYANKEYDKWAAFVDSRYLTNEPYNVEFQPNTASEKEEILFRGDRVSFNKDQLKSKAFGRTFLYDNRSKIGSVMYKEAFISEKMLFETYTHEWYHQLRGYDHIFTLEKGFQHFSIETKLEDACTIQVGQWAFMNRFRLEGSPIQFRFSRGNNYSWTW